MAEILDLYFTYDKPCASLYSKKWLRRSSLSGGDSIKRISINLGKAWVMIQLRKYVRRMKAELTLIAVVLGIAISVEA